MDATSCKKLVDSYVAWLKAGISTKDVNGVCEITTPFLDRHNDKLQIYLIREAGGLKLTDDGYIIGDLESSGCAIDTPNRKQLLGTILAGFGVKHHDGELFVEATAEDFPRKKHALLQAMVTVNDMFMTAKHRVVSLFIEDVQHFLDQSDVRYSPSVEFTGKSGFSHKFDFLIPKSPRKPERLLRAINSPTRDAAMSLLFAWTDTKDTRPPNAQLYAVLNDQSKGFNQEALSAFAHYDVRTILWSQRDQYASELAA